MVLEFRGESLEDEFLNNRDWNKSFLFLNSLSETMDLAFSQICDIAQDDRRITTFMTMMSAEVLVECAHLSYGARVTGLVETVFLFSVFVKV